MRPLMRHRFQFVNRIKSCVKPTIKPTVKPIIPLALIAILTLSVLASAPLSTLRAQGSGVTITVAVPSFMADTLSQNAFDKFTADHPGVKVKVVNDDDVIPMPAAGLDKTLQAEQKYASAGDVEFVDITQLWVEATRAGIFLDLAPLVQADKSLNPDDFYPSAWNAFQWDKGIWALPSSVDTDLLTYKPAAFDAAGLAYPSESWTVDDLVNAARKLAQKDSTGAVTTAGLDYANRDDLVGLILSLAGEPSYDIGTIPDTPQFAKPSFEKVMDALSQLDQDGLIKQDFNNAPMSIGPIFGALSTPATPADKSVAVLLPGGKALLDVQGFAVSGGTQHPNEAYELVKYLTMHPEAGARFGASSALKNAQTAPGGATFNVAGGGGDAGSSGAISVGSVSSSDSGSSDPGVIAIGPIMPPELKAISDKALANGLAASDGRYFDYLILAYSNMKKNGLDAHTALTAVEAQAVADQKAAIAKKNTLAVVVATPIPALKQPGKATLNFDITTFIRPLPSQDVWNRLADEFASTDSQIGEVDLQIGGDNINQAAAKSDCFYLPFNGVPSATLSNLLNLDQLLGSDSTFDKSDVLPGILEQLQRDGKTWGYPLMIAPSMLQYDAAKFAAANVPAPVSGWTVEAFNDALKALKPNSKEPPFVSSTPGGTYLLLLMAAYGGVPIDYRTNPPTINYTDPAVVQAIQQVLDLAKNGYIKYDQLAPTGPFMTISAGVGDESPITTESVDGGLRIMRIAPGQTNMSNPYQSVDYPHGSTSNALSYGMGAAYISAKSQNPEACYRFISMLAQHPELFDSMPVRMSQIKDPTYAASQGADTAALYQRIAALLSDPNTIPFPSMFEGGISPTGFITQHWLFEAFDNYVLNNADLLSALKDAETYSNGYQQCIAGLPAYDPTDTQSEQQYFKGSMDCAVKIDPRLSAMFPKQ